ncbi:hypothetical protein ACJD0Z_14140 [Flavobacteriaceae bacterium M23B6Z8]
MCATSQNKDLPSFKEKNRLTILAEILEKLFLVDKNEKRNLPTQEELDFICVTDPDEVAMTERLITARILIKSYKYSGDERYLNHLKRFIHQKVADRILTSRIKNHSLSQGKSGWLLVLLYTISYVNEPWMILHVRNLAAYFLSGLYPISKQGLYYISGEDDILPKCGLEEGNSGIALVYMKLGHFFNNVYYTRIATQLLAAEDELLRRALNNGGTYQGNITSLQDYELAKEHYLVNNKTAMLPLMEDYSFSSGLLGVVCVRIKAYKYTKTEIYREQAEELLLRIRTADAQKTVSLKANDRNLLQALSIDQQGVISRIFEEVKPAQDQTISLETILKKYFRLPFVYTLRIAHQLQLSLVEDFCKAYEARAFLNTNPLKDFYRYVKSSYQKSDLPGSQQLVEIVRFEYQKIRLQKSIKNMDLFIIEDLVAVERRDQLLQQAIADLWQTTLKLNQHLMILQTQWRWVVEEIDLFRNSFDVLENLKQPASNHFEIVYANSQYDIRRRTFVHEKPLTEYQYIVLDLFEYPVTVREVFEEFQKLFEISSPAELQSVQNVFLKIVRDAVFDRFLVKDL